MWKKNLLYTSVILRFFVNPKNDLYIFYKIVRFIDSKDSSYTYYFCIFCPLSYDSLRRRCGMYYLTVAHIYRNMSRVAKDIARLSIFKIAITSLLVFFDRNACSGPDLTGSGKFYSEVRIYAHYKSRAVTAVRKAGASVHIRVADKLACIFDNLLSECI